MAGRSKAGCYFVTDQNSLDTLDKSVACRAAILSWFVRMTGRNEINHNFH
jgi:hypothetical protein